ncbi:phospholipid carrier-dependent glycosyltransferase [Streptomyces triticagri]|uniref:Polyprenol-phosphate-mannose--protein mannosyltransferase n=1 Tax=Streptomyces triticagri TaxID=2293568 RepID=A0A372MCL4_9ACTN|nr:phospholipid carrier-dependent glycosyltransferase [Streptomyces triticagri]RFU88678.1 phospholipid carrier-dependent glycosyltransferase [Streptomyces triticagri]
MTSTASSTDAAARQQGPAGQQQPSWQRRLRRFGYVPAPRTPVRERLVPPYREPGPRLWAALGIPADRAARLVKVLAWAGPLLVALVAGALRFWRLGKPHDVIFDETYYAKDAWALIQRGYEVEWPKNFDDTVLSQGSGVTVPTDPSYVVHPPVGKWIIGLGEWMFGFDPFGWRFMVAVLGTLSVLMLCRIGRRLFRSTFLGCLAGGLLAVDGLHFVMSRTALLDLIVMFFVLAAFGCLVIDRDRVRARLAAALPTDPDGVVRPDVFVGDELRLGWRPWRLAAGVCLGLAFATKWNGLYVLAAFALMSVLWDVGARRTAGAAAPYRAVLRRDVLPAFVSTVPVAIVTYVASWTGWILSDKGYLRDWATEAGQGGSWTWLPDWVRSLWHYEYTVYQFHVSLTDNHTYQSNPWSWLVAGRPVSYYYESPGPGRDGCPSGTADKCASEVLALGTPLLWWAGCFALAYVVWRWLLRRDWRAGAILCGVAAGYLPWFAYQERTIFVFYAVVFVPFLCLAVAMMIGALLGPPGATERRRTIGAVASGVLVLLIVWNFIYFWPIYTGQPIPIDQWRSRMWFDTWV